MRFNIEKFYIQHHIPYITKGTNVKRGEVNIACPFCGDDPSFHLGVDPKTGFWSCWRNRRQHKGKKLHRLIMKLLGCSFDKASNILGDKISWVEEGSFDSLAENLDGIFAAELAPAKFNLLSFPQEFIEFKGQRSSLPFVRYIQGRGFHQDDVEDVIKEYNLMYAISGLQKDRVILPLFLDYSLIGWTGRSIHSNTTLRYLSLSEKDGAKISIKSTIFNFDELLDRGGDTLFVCEGPWDAVKLDFYAKELGSSATCLFNKMISSQQAVLLYELSSVFNRIVALLDAGELADSLYLDSSLSFLGEKMVIGQLPDGVNDPGDLNFKQIKELCSKYNL